MNNPFKAVKKNSDAPMPEPRLPAAPTLPMPRPSPSQSVQVLLELERERDEIRARAMDLEVRARTAEGQLASTLNKLEEAQRDRDFYQKKCDQIEAKFEVIDQVLTDVIGAPRAPRTLPPDHEQKLESALAAPTPDAAPPQVSYTPEEPTPPGKGFHDA